MVELRQVGSFFRSAQELRVKGRLCEKLVDGVLNQQVDVQRVLAESFPGIPVRPVLCFIDSEWPLFGKAFEHRDVVVTWPKKL